MISTNFGVIESPYAPKGPRPDVELARNLAYVRAAMRWCALRDLVPIASHALYTQPGVLDDTIEVERNLGIGLGKRTVRALCFAAMQSDPRIEIINVRHLFFLDRGRSHGMTLAAAWHEQIPGLGRPEEVYLGDVWHKSLDDEWLVHDGVLTPRELR